MIERKEIVISGGGLAGLIAAAAFGNSGYKAVSYTHLTLPTNREV